MTIILKSLSSLLLRGYKWKLLHIVITDQPKKDFCTVESFWPVDLCPWNDDVWLKSICSNLVWVSTQKQYMATFSYIHGRSILHGTCALLDYFILLTFSLENMTFNLKILFRHLLKQFKWQHIFTAYQSAMGLHSRVILTLKLLYMFQS